MLHHPKKQLMLILGFCLTALIIWAASARAATLARDSWLTTTLTLTPDTTQQWDIDPLPAGDTHIVSITTESSLSFQVQVELGPSPTHTLPAPTADFMRLDIDPQDVDKTIWLNLRNRTADWFITGFTIIPTGLESQASTPTLTRLVDDPIAANREFDTYFAGPLTGPGKHTATNGWMTIPEPSTALLALLGYLTLTMRRKP